jgi:hypothetical protein
MALCLCPAGIPGRGPKAANPESRNERRACIWIPGPALTRRPGMTAKCRDLSRHARATHINVMAGLDPAISVFLTSCLLRGGEDVDARNKCGHDGCFCCAHPNEMAGTSPAMTSWISFE